MRRHRGSLAAFLTACLCLAFTAGSAQAQKTMSMPGVENSVGFLASGTSVEPLTTSESSPMVHRTFGNWMFMFHANAFLADIQQTGPRGRDKFFSANWMMPMVSRQFGRHGLSVRTMLSFEPATVTKRQYPLLLQTGESAYGLSITDGQHPHDFIMELAAKYDFKFAERSQVFVYGGPVGEPAFGPAGFPHRASASENPIAVLGHHLQDSTHIATNVITLGFAQGPVQVEASTFHGREPNESRWNINRGKPDSFSTRLTVSPHKSLSAQFSTGRINNPEEFDPTLDTVRTTASAHHNVQLGSGHISSSLIWGRNKDLKDGSRRIFNSYNLEITSKFAGHNWVWTRIENVDRDRSLLPVQPTCLLCGVVGFSSSKLQNDTEVAQFNHVVMGPDGRPVTVEELPIGRIQAYTVGYERELPVGPSWLNVGLGAQFTTYGLTAQLKGIYGNRPATAVVFLRLRPRGNMTEHMRQMHQALHKK
jgi:hypothetical protein